MFAKIKKGARHFVRLFLNVVVMKCGDSTDLLNMFFTPLFPLSRFNNFIKAVKIMTDYHPVNYRK